MPSFRFLAALLMAVTWFTGLLHAELEGTGLLPEHAHFAATHAHEHTHGPAADLAHDHSHEPACAAHTPLEARPAPGLLNLLITLGQTAACALPLFALARLLLRAAHLHRVPAPRPWFERGAWMPGVSAWRFIHRCAADSLAPPRAA